MANQCKVKGPIILRNNITVTRVANDREEFSGIAFGVFDPDFVWQRETGGKGEQREDKSERGRRLVLGEDTKASMVKILKK